MASRIAVVVLNDFTRDNRVLKVASTLAEAGQKVEVVALPGQGLPEREARAGGWTVRRLRLGIWTSDRMKGVRFARLAYFAWQVVWGYRRWDAWHCNDAEAFALGVVAKALRPSLRLIYDCHEFEAERNAKSKRYLAWVATLERRFIHLAESVITVSPSIRQAYRERYGAHGIPAVHLVRNVPHAVKPSSIQVDGFRSRFGLAASDFIALYQGSFTFNRGLEVALETAAQMEGEGVHFVFMGYGPLLELVQEAAAAHANVHYHEAVPYEAVLAHTATADVGLVSVKPTCLSYLYCLPNKLFEYIQAGLPILSNALPDCAALINRYQIGEVVESDDATGWASAIRTMREKSGNYTEGLKTASLQLQWQKEAHLLLEAHGIKSSPFD